MGWLSDIFNPSSSAAGPANQQLQLMEAQQAKHDAAVRQGRQSIDQVFAQFTPDYFSGYTQTYKDAYNPQLTDQYNRAKNQMIATLAGNDQLEGSAGAYDLGQLDKTYGTEQANIANKAQEATNNLRSTVDNSKTQLYGLNAATADPLTMASQAQATSGAIVAPQSYPTLSNVFGDALNSVATGAGAYANSLYRNSAYYPPAIIPPAPIGGAGSSVQT